MVLKQNGDIRRN